MAVNQRGDKYDLEITQGIDYNLQLFVVSSLEMNDNATEVLDQKPADLTGFNLVMEIRDSASKNSTLVMMLKSTSNTSPKDGKISITIPASDSLNFVFSCGTYGIILISSQKKIFNLLSGFVFINPAIVR